MSEPQITLLLGDEFRCERALAQRVTALEAIDPNCERRVLFGDELEPASFEMELRSTSLFALVRHFIVRDVERLKAAKELSPTLATGFPIETFVTLVARELKTTSPILKACKAIDAVVALPTPKGRAVPAAVREILASMEIDASPDAIRRLVFRNGGTLLGIAQEAKKLRSFAPGSTVTEEIVDQIVFPSAEQTVYPFFDRLGERDLAGALATLNDVRDDAGRILGGAIRHLARLAMVRAVQEQKGKRMRLSEALGLPDWLCKRLAGQAKHHTLDDLARSLQAGVRLDLRMKRGELSAGDALLQLTFEATAPA